MSVHSGNVADAVEAIGYIHQMNWGHRSGLDSLAVGRWIALAWLASCAAACTDGQARQSAAGRVRQSLQAGSDAAFVSTNFPTLLAPAERRMVQVVMQNDGAASPANDWSTAGSYALHRQGGTWGWVYKTVNANVAVGNNHTFNFLITAPGTAGTYAFGAQMRVLSDSFFGDVVNVPGVVVDAGQARMWDCSLISTTIPSSMAPGESRSVSVTLKNTGTATWLGGAQFYLRSQDTPAARWLNTSTLLTTDVAPLGTKTLNMSIVAPTTPGTYTLQREMWDGNGVGVFATSDFCVDLSVNVGGCSASPDADGDGVGDACDACNGRLYGQTVELASDVSETTVLDAVNGDLIPALAQMTGASFTLVHGGSPPAACVTEGKSTIHLLTAGSSMLASAPTAVGALAQQLTGAARDAFVIHAVPGQGLWVVGANQSGLRRGVYEYLHRLGVRWYLPNEHWTIVPSAQDVRVNVQALRNPAYRQMAFAGTGGFGSNLPVPNGSGPKLNYSAWARRNRLPSQHAIGGHTGEAYNYAFASTLRADPLYMAEVGGVRETLPPGNFAADAAIEKPHYTYHGGLCGTPQSPQACGQNEAPTWEDPSDYSSDGGVIKLYGDWRVTKLAQAIGLYGADSAASELISVDPADGGRHCECDKCLALLRQGPYRDGNGQPLSMADSSVSDRVFHLANETAKKVHAAYPGHGVSLLAYDDRAAPPTIPLEPNMVVRVTPHRYQSEHTGLTAEELIDAWGAKAASNSKGPFGLGIYDYWAITDETLDRPMFSPRRAASKLRFWADKGISDLQVETSHSAGAVGIAHLLASRFAWDPDLDEEAVLDEFFTLSFGAAAPPMQRMFERWWARYAASWDELGRSYEDVLEASDLLASGSCTSCVARLDDVKGYLHYLRLRMELDFASANDRPALVDAIYRHIWRIHQTGFVSTYRLHDLLWRTYQYPAWDLSNASATGWATVTPLTTVELDQLMDDGATTYEPLAGIEPRVFSGEWIARTPSSQASGDSESQVFNQPLDFAFVAPPSGHVTVRVRNFTNGSTAKMRVSIRNASGVTVSSSELDFTSLTWVWHDIPLVGLANETHTIELFKASTAQQYKVSVPAAVPFAQVGAQRALNSPAAANQYFYVPSGTQRFVLNAWSAVEPTFYNPQGAVVSASKYGTNLYVVDVPTGEDGKVWKLAGIKTEGSTSAFFTNLPNSFAPTAAQVLVPAELSAEIP
jgi:hypothetical protein